MHTIFLYVRKTFPYFKDPASKNKINKLETGNNTKKNLSQVITNDTLKTGYSLSRTIVLPPATAYQGLQTERFAPFVCFEV